MNILLATGIYPPDIGGPATYAKHLAEELTKQGYEVRVVTYVETNNEKLTMKNHDVILVGKHGNMFSRWIRYAKALREHGKDADVVIALSSVSVGVPLLLARLKKPKKVLRLGGDFFWERYTDAGGMLGLRAWYEKSWGFWRMMNLIFMGLLLRSFDLLVYSTEFQRQIHEKIFVVIPRTVVIENAAPTPSPSPAHSTGSGQEGRGGRHEAHTPFRLLTLSRFVGFKNLEALVKAMLRLKEKNMQLTMIGSGPRESSLRALVHSLALAHVVTFRPPTNNIEKLSAFHEHDLLVIPSTTDISPNTALEARAASLPVLLTRETGLSSRLTFGMVLADLVRPEDIANAIEEIQERYDTVAREASAELLQHDWSDVALEWHTHLTKLA